MFWAWRSKTSLELERAQTIVKLLKRAARGFLASIASTVFLPGVHKAERRLLAQTMHLNGVRVRVGGPGVGAPPPQALPHMILLIVQSSASA